MFRGEEGMQPPLSRGSHSVSFLGKLASLGSSENWPITFWGKGGLSPYPVLDSTCQKQLCIRFSWPDSSSAVAVHTLFTAAPPPPPLFPPVPVCLDILAGAGQITVLQHLLCPLSSSSSCALHGVGELTRGAAHPMPPGTMGHKCPWRAVESPACRGKGSLHSTGGLATFLLHYFQQNDK